MSELINNVSKKRQEKLREIILSLHDGATLEDAITEFRKHFDSVTTKEITEMEQSLLKEGITVDQIQKLCDVHAAVFEGSISDIHGLSDYDNKAGHPAKVFTDENRRIEQLIDEEIRPYLEQSGKTPILMLRIAYDRLKEIDKHYARKENLFFPKLERVGITAPPKVMWGVDDEIRAEIKEIIELLAQPHPNEQLIKEKINLNITKIVDMIFKEDNILMPLVLENMTHYDWILVDASSDEVGYFLEKPKESWIIEKVEEIEEDEVVAKGVVPMSAGSLTFEEVDSILNTLPLDLTFVDAEGYVKYFTQGKTRIFVRPKTVLGRHVTMCHPPQSVDVVEEIVESLRSGEKDYEEFWIDFQDMFVLISFYAVRSKEGEYLGVLEITQDIKPLRMLKGEKRLLEPKVKK